MNAPKPPALHASRDPETHQVMIFPDEDRQLHKEFILAYVEALNPADIVERQLARRLAQDTWRLNRIHAIEENLFAMDHSAFHAEVTSDNPAITTAWCRAKTWSDNPKTFALLSLYEQRITKNFHANMRLLLKLQKIRQTKPTWNDQPEPTHEKEQVRTASATAAAEAPPDIAADLPKAA